MVRYKYWKLWKITRKTSASKWNYLRFSSAWLWAPRLKNFALLHALEKQTIGHLTRPMGWQPQVNMLLLKHHLLFFLVDIEYCNLKKVTKVNTWLTCSSGCWAVSGADGVYNLSPSGFTTYLYQNNGVVNKDNAAIWKYVLHYEVTGICWTTFCIFVLFCITINKWSILLFIVSKMKV